MDILYDFSNDPQSLAPYGGTDRKYSVVHNNEIYMLKFSERRATKTDMTTSYVNNVVSEYISSHIADAIGLPVHDTVLGIRNGQLVVGCKDFRQAGEQNYEFKELIRATYDSADVKRAIRLDQIYEALDQNTLIQQELKEQSIQRYWDTFVVDSLVGNFDRHMGNWGYLIRDNQINLAPTYDYGSTLLPQLSEEGIDEIMQNKYEMSRRCLVFPSPALFILKEKAGKVGYYDMMASGYDPQCTEAVLRIHPRIDLQKIHHVIDETPLISDKRKQFYKNYIDLRKELILDKAYQCCKDRHFDQQALIRIQTGKQFSDDDLKELISESTPTRHKSQAEKEIDRKNQQFDKSFDPTNDKDITD